jgi:Tryptophan synthase alpha chain
MKQESLYRSAVLVNSASFHLLALQLLMVRVLQQCTVVMHCTVVSIIEAVYTWCKHLTVLCQRLRSSADVLNTRQHGVTVLVFITADNATAAYLTKVSNVLCVNCAQCHLICCYLNPTTPVMLLVVIVPYMTERMPYVASAADTFIYCVSVTGVTGARTGLPDDLKEFIARIRAKVSCFTLPRTLSVCSSHCCLNTVSILLQKAWTCSMLHILCVTLHV